MPKRGLVLAFITAIISALTASSNAVTASRGVDFRTIAPTVAPELPLLPEVVSVNGVAHVSLTAAIDPSTSLPAFYFAGRAVAPTIRLKPGDTLVIDYTNKLPASTTAPINITNLHTHGLLDSPQQPGDQVIMTMILPGQTYRYVYAIPRTQPPGLYWYHPHPHGETNHQAGSGMSGLIVIEGIEAYAPVVRGLPERDIILRDYYLPGHRNPLANTGVPSTIPVSDRCNPNAAEKGITINGLPSATITMQAGSRQFFRVANASSTTFFDLKIPGREFFVVANDGVPLSYHDSSVQGEIVDHILIPPAGRTEAVVLAPRSMRTPLQTGCVDYGPFGEDDPLRNVATIALGTPQRLPHMATTSALRPAREPFGDIRSWPIAAHRTVNFSEIIPPGKFLINGQSYDPNAAPMFTAKVGTVEEWTVSNYAPELHAFHIHQIHFLVEDINGVKQPPYTWRDMIRLPYATKVGNTLKPSVMHLLMDFRDPIVAGMFVFHCHILPHEDLGMMAKLEVLGPTVALADTHGFHSGFLTKGEPALCKLQTKNFKLCGCDKRHSSAIVASVRGGSRL
jgi:FtsP/CotA-like multicopper oxidase with cupredoxin domain